MAAAESSAQAQPSCRINDMRLVRESIDRFYDYDIHIESRTLWIGDDKEEGVNQRTSEYAVKALHMLQQAAPDKDITIYLNSFGGCWFNGMAIYDAIKLCPCPVTVLCRGVGNEHGFDHPSGVPITDSSIRTRPSWYTTGMRLA
jgi:ATP-dependent protease ClpP protease subunit